MHETQISLKGDFQHVHIIEKDTGPYPQPNLEKPIRLPTFDDIFRSSFNLNFRGRVHARLERIQQVHGFQLDSILPNRTNVPMFKKDESDIYLEIIQRYLYPHVVDDKWLKWPTQEEVSPQLRGLTSPPGFKGTLLRALHRIEHRVQFGPNSITTFMPKNPLYRVLLKNKLHIIDNVIALQGAFTPIDLGDKLETESYVEELSSLIRVNIYPEFQLEAKFANQLPPEEAFARYHK